MHTASSPVYEHSNYTVQCHFIILLNIFGLPLFMQADSRTATGWCRTVMPEDSVKQSNMNIYSVSWYIHKYISHPIFSHNEQGEWYGYQKYRYLVQRYAPSKPTLLVNFFL
jgi:hypothetical protein